VCAFQFFLGCAGNGRPNSSSKAARNAHEGNVIHTQIIGGI
jgi:hypothetical protein